MSLYKERELGHEAQRILESDVWKEAWAAYRTNLLDAIESAASSDEVTVMHFKRLLAAATAAKKHMERLVAEGVVAVKTLELEEKRGLLRRIREAV